MLTPGVFRSGTTSTRWLISLYFDLKTEEWDGGNGGLISVSWADAHVEHPKKGLMEYTYDILT